MIQAWAHGSAKTLRAGSDVNPYRYCGNSPTNGTDPSGEFPYDHADDSASIRHQCLAELQLIPNVPSNDRVGQTTGWEDTDADDDGPSDYGVYDFDESPVGTFPVMGVDQDWGPAQAAVALARSLSRNRAPDPIRDLLAGLPGGGVTTRLWKCVKPGGGGMAGLLLPDPDDIADTAALVGSRSIAAGDSPAQTLYVMGAYPAADLTGVANASYTYDNTNPMTGQRAGTAETWLRTGVGSLQLLGTASLIEGALPGDFGGPGIGRPTSPRGQQTPQAKPLN